MTCDAAAGEKCQDYEDRPAECVCRTGFFEEDDGSCTGACYGLFTLLDSDTDFDSVSGCKPNDYAVVCRTFQTALSWIQISIITANHRNGIRIGI